MANPWGPVVVMYALHGPHSVDVDVVGTKQPAVLELFADRDDKHVVRASSIAPYSDEPMAIMFVMQGEERTMGNDQIVLDPDYRTPGILRPFEDIVDNLDLAHRLPRGSEVGIVMYAAAANVRLPLSPVAQFHGASFGTQQDYYRQSGSELLRGMMVGIDELAHSTARHRLLIVIGGGFDTDMATAKPRLAERLKRAATEHVSIDAIYYPAPDLGDPPVRLPNAKNVNSVKGITQVLEDIIDNHLHGFRATFDTSSLPVWDGKAHDLTLRVDGTDTEPTSLTFGVLPHRAWWTTAWFRIVVGFGVLALFGLVGWRMVKAKG